MQCSACQTDSNNLREYSRVVTIREHRKTIETAYLCPACRIMKALNPQCDSHPHLRISRLSYVASLIQPDGEEGEVMPVRRTSLPC